MSENDRSDAAASPSDADSPAPPVTASQLPTVPQDADDFARPSGISTSFAPHEPMPATPGPRQDPPPGAEAYAAPGGADVSFAPARGVLPARGRHRHRRVRRTPRLPAVGPDADRAWRASARAARRRWRCRTGARNRRRPEERSAIDLPLRVGPENQRRTGWPRRRCGRSRSFLDTFRGGTRATSDRRPRGRPRRTGS